MATMMADGCDDGATEDSDGDIADEDGCSDGDLDLDADQEAGGRGVGSKRTRAPLPRRVKLPQGAWREAAAGGKGGGKK
jgi:hypothetical protein